MTDLFSPSMSVIQIDWQAAPRTRLGPRLRTICALVCDSFGVSELDIRGEIRAYSAPRFAFCWLARSATGHSYPRIARYVYRDHTTVMYGVKRAEQLRKDDADFARKTDTILAQLKN